MKHLRHKLKPLLAPIATWIAASILVASATVGVLATCHLIVKRTVPTPPPVVESIGIWDPVLPKFYVEPVKKVRRFNSLVLSVTGYCLPGITASGTGVRTGIIALSQDLIRDYTAGAPFHYGDTVHLQGLGPFVVEDCMAPYWTNRADIWFATEQEARQWGIRKVKVSKSSST